jgi:hypothetical protein
MPLVRLKYYDRIDPGKHLSEVDWFFEAVSEHTGL